MLVSAPFVTALLSATAVAARGFHVEKRALAPRAGTPAGKQCVSFNIGNDSGTTSSSTGLQVCATISGGQITITYPTFTDTKTYNDVHVWLGCTVPTGDSPGTAPGQYPITTGGKNCTVSADKKSATCSATLPQCVGCDTKLYIISHADTSAGTGQGYVQNQCIASGKSGCSPWFTYWSITPSCVCTTVNTFAPTSTYSTVGASTDIASTSVTCGIATNVVQYTTSTLTYYVASAPTSTSTAYSYYIASSSVSEVVLYSTSLDSSYVTGVTTSSTDSAPSSSTSVVNVPVSFPATCPYMVTPPPTTATGACS